MSSSAHEDERAKEGVTRRTLLWQLGIGGASSTLPLDRIAHAADEKPNRKLLLGGGGIRGAYQAGAIVRLLANGFQPNVIYGVSVGGLNAAFLGDRAFFLGKTKTEYFSTLGRAIPPGVNPASLVDWPFIGQQLVEFWRQNVTSERSLIRKKRSAAVAAIFRSFSGVFDTSPLQTLIRKTLSAERLRRSGIPVGVAAVNIDNAETTYFFEDDPNFIDAVIATAAVPLAMPIVELTVGGVKKRFCDGGLRETLPTGLALKEVAGKIPTHLVCIACQPPQSKYPILRNPGNFVELLQRTADIAADEIIKNDIAALNSTKIKYILIRPSRTVNWDPKKNKTFDIDSFDQSQIAALLDEGAFSANKALADPVNRFVEGGYKSI